MKKGKILRICHKFLKDEDGYDLDIQDLCRSTANEYENHVMTFATKEELELLCRRKDIFEKNGRFRHDETQAWITPVLLHSKQKGQIKDLLRPKNLIKTSRAIRQSINEIKPDVVHIHGTVLPQSLIGAMIARAAKKQTIVVATHHNGRINKQSEQPPGVQMIKWICHNLMPIICHKTMTVSEHGKKSFMLDKYVTVINPAPYIKSGICATPKQIEASNTLKNGFKLNKDDRIIFCPNRICPQKNQHTLVRAFIEAAKHSKKLKLVISGKEGDRLYLRDIHDLIQKSDMIDRVCISGPLNNKTSHSIIRLCDAVAVPSINEGLGRSAMEALTLGKPVIASKECGYNDIIQHEKNGLLVDPNDTNELTKAIIEIHRIKPGPTKTHRQYIAEIMELYNQVEEQKPLKK